MNFVGRGEFTSFIRKVVLYKQSTISVGFTTCKALADNAVFFCFCSLLHILLYSTGTLTYFTDRNKVLNSGIMFLLPKTGAANQLLRGPLSVPMDKQVV
jgi:hypothetical protein